MTTLPTILLVVCEPLTNAVVRSQALGHAAIMARLGVCQFRILALGLGKEMHAANLIALKDSELLAEAPILAAEGFRPVLPWADRGNARAIVDAVRQAGWGRFAAIHARADYAARLSIALRAATGTPLIWDCRGDSLAELEFRPAGPGRALRRAGLARRRAIVAQVADRAIFVSHPLRQAIGAAWSATKPAAIIPCGADSAHFHLDLEARARERSRLGLREDQPLFIYSGGLAPYQMLTETVEHFTRMRTEAPDARMLVLCPDREGASRLSGGTPGLAVESADRAGVNALLNAADFGYMLRAPVPTNIVSSPTKFAEYAMTGLPVIMTDAVPDSAALASNAGILVDPSWGWPQLQRAWPDRAHTASHFAAILSREAQAPLYRRIYGLN